MENADKDDDWSEPGDEAWWTGIRPWVIDYLRSQGVVHRRVGERPAWLISPIVSIWAIESFDQPDWVGWWVICGDLPTDYCSSDGCRHPRLALRRIVASWQQALAQHRPGDKKIACTGIGADLADMLKARADILDEWADDDGLWPEHRYGDIR